MKTPRIILNILAVGAIVFLPYAGLFPFFGYSIPIILIVWFVLKYGDETFSDIGFNWKRFELKFIPIGGFVALLTLAFMQLVFHPILDSILPLEYKDTGLSETIRSGKIQLFIMIFMGWLIGGFYEEIVFHGFIFTRLEKMLKRKYATHLSISITAFIFGMYHITLGAAGVVNALVVGMVYLALFLYFERNLWCSIFCHGFYNTTVMLLIYFGYI